MHVAKAKLCLVTVAMASVKVATSVMGQLLSCQCLSKLLLLVTRGLFLNDADPSH